MAHFYSAIQGSRGEATRLGTTASGIRAQAQGWDTGAKVYGNVVDDRDEFSIYATSGSDYRGIEVYLGKVVCKNGSVTWIPAKGAQVESITEKPNEVDSVRKAYWDDATVSNAEYGQMIETAAQSDDARMLELERDTDA
jgi:hypothetical protein